MDFSSSFSEVLARAGSWLESVRELAIDFIDSGVMLLAEHYPLVSGYLPQIYQWCLVCLALAVLLLARRVRRDRRAMRGITGELERHLALIDDLQSAFADVAERVNRQSNDVSDLALRQRSVEARVGKPDPKVAAAMARAGTARQQMIECGLSHGEVHLIRALSMQSSKTPMPDGSNQVA